MLIAWFVGTFSAALVLTIVSERVAKHFRILSKSSYRRKVSEGTPLLGGVPIVLAVIPGLLFFSPDFGANLLLASSPLLLLGFCDDLWEIGGRWKLTAQVLAAVLWIYLTPQNTLIFHEVFVHPLIAVALTVAWLIGLTNAYNLIDGVDGQASVMGIINWTALALIFPEGQFAWIMVAAQLGFLMRNFTPAQIYLGEIGSSFLGFSLSAVTSVIHTPRLHFGHLVGIIFLFAVPLFDTVSAIYRRVRRGESLFRGDREHVHHRLTKLQFSTVQTVLVMSILTFAGSATFILAFKLNTPILQSTVYAISSSLMFLCLFGVQFCEKHFSQRVLSLGRGLLSKHLAATQISSLAEVPKRAIVIDLLPCFRELQMQGVLTLHEFLKDFAELISKTDGKPLVRYLGSYSVTLLFTDKTTWAADEIVAFASPCHALFQEYHCLSSAKAVPECLRFFGQDEALALLPMLEINPIDQVRQKVA